MPLIDQEPPPKKEPRKPMLDIPGIAWAVTSTLFRRMLTDEFGLPFHLLAKAAIRAKTEGISIDEAVEQVKKESQK